MSIESSPRNLCLSDIFDPEVKPGDYSGTDREALIISRNIIAALGVVALAGGLVRTMQHLTPDEEKLTPQAEVVKIVNEHIANPTDDDPISRRAKVLTLDVAPGDSPQGIANRVVDEGARKGYLSVDDMNNAYGTINLTSENSGGLRPGDTLIIGIGDINDDRKKDVVILGSERNSDSN